MAAGRLRQLSLLLWKNWLFSIRSWKATLLQLFAPCFFILLVTALSYVTPALKDDPHPKSSAIGTLPQCQGWNGKNCTSVLALNLTGLIFPNPRASECVHDIMTKFANMSGLHYGTDVFVPDNSTALFFNDTHFIDYFTEHNNQTGVAIAFLECDTNITAPKLNYTILYNSSRALKFQQLIFGSPDKPDGRVEVATLVDSIFMGLVLNKSVTVSVNVTTFPVFYQLPSVQANQATSATTFIFCAITFQFVMMMYNIVSEKDLKLRQGLKLIGMKDSIYWASWAITGLVIAFLSTVVLMATGYACQLQFFLNTNFLINFILFLLYSISMIPLAFFASVFISTVRQAVNTGMLIFVVGMMVVNLLGNTFLLTQLYIYVEPLVVVLSFLPPFHLVPFLMAKAIADIGSASSDTDFNGLPQESYHYGWHDLVKKRNITLFDFSSPADTSKFNYYEMPATIVSLASLVGNVVLYSVLAWYLDSVLRGNHGIPRKWYFPFQPSYWCDCLPHYTRRVEEVQRRALSPPDVQGDSNSSEDSTEATALLQTRERYGSDEGDALRIQDLKKTFSTGCCSRRQLPAVDGLSLCAREDQVLALLGHNGAGKTTTINMLIGLLEPDDGDAYFYNLSVRQDLDLIRSVLGVCPQHDVLWGDLTAREHMKMFAMLKDIPSGRVEEEIAFLLEEVQLSPVANHRVKTFSGGMKRRLSVAMSLLGDPKVMFLDEPTTGMDPKIRRAIWNLILRMKKDKVIIMTTHSMEEADILGDNIAIMANGQLKVMGTSVNLKNRFAGYNIELVVLNEDVQEVANLVLEHLPGATAKDPVEVEGGMLLPYNLPPERHAQIVPFFKVIEGDPAFAKKIIDYSISQTTLEEVFLNVTLNELFKDRAYQPVLMRSSSFAPTSPTSPTSPHPPPPPPHQDAKPRVTLT